MVGRARVTQDRQRAGLTDLALVGVLSQVIGPRRVSAARTSSGSRSMTAISSRCRRACPIRTPRQHPVERDAAAGQVIVALGGLRCHERLVRPLVGQQAVGFQFLVVVSDLQLYPVPLTVMRPFDTRGSALGGPGGGVFAPSPDR